MFYFKFNMNLINNLHWFRTQQLENIQLYYIEC